MQDCENERCDREPHNQQTKLCIHHYNVYNLFVDSGMNRARAEVYATIDTSHLHTGSCSCRLAEEFGTGRRNMCNRKLARGLGLCNYHLSICSRRAREEGVPLPELIDAMVLEHENELRRVKQEMNRNVARRVEQRRAGQRRAGQRQEEQHSTSDTPPGPAAQAESPAMKARREQAAAAAAQRKKQQREQRQRAAEKAKAEAKQRAADNVAVALKTYEGSWAALEEKVTADATACATITISLADIVSPPDCCPLGIVLPDAASKDQKKQALRAASLRWHPDKFVAKFGRLLPVPSKQGSNASLREAILAKVTRTFQLINAERERLLPD